MREERRRGVREVEEALASCCGCGFVSGVSSEEGTDSGMDESVGRISEDGQGPEYKARSWGSVKLRAGWNEVGNSFLACSKLLRARNGTEWFVKYCKRYFRRRELRIIRVKRSTILQLANYSKHNNTYTN